MAEGLDLTPPAAVAEVKPVEAEREVPVPPEAAARIETMVGAFAESIASLDTQSDAYRRRIDEISNLGEREIRSTSEMSNRLLDRPTRALGTVLDGSAPIGKSLVELRHTVEELNPARYDLSRGGPRKLLGVIPFGDRIRGYFDKYAKAHKHIEGIVGSLRDGREELVRDNAAIDQEQRSLWTQMETLRQYTYLAERLDTILEEKIQAVETTDAEKARVLREDVLFPIRQRRQAILTQLAVAAQGYAALRVVEKNNHEVIRAIQTATTTTVAALRTAVMVAQALTNQKLVVDQLKAVNEVTSGMIESTSTLLRDQTAEIEPLASGTGIDMAALQRAWDNVFAALDQIDNYKLNALEAMRLTVRDLTSQVERSRSYVERLHGGTEPGALPAHADEPTLRLS